MDHVQKMRLTMGVSTNTMGGNWICYSYTVYLWRHATILKTCCILSWTEPRTQNVAKKMFNLGMKFLRLYKVLCFLHVRRGHDATLFTQHVHLRLFLVLDFGFSSCLYSTWGRCNDPCARQGQWAQMAAQAKSACILSLADCKFILGNGHWQCELYIILYIDVQQHMQGSNIHKNAYILYSIYTLNLQKPFKT